MTPKQIEPETVNFRVQGKYGFQPRMVGNLNIDENECVRAIKILHVCTFGNDVAAANLCAPILDDCPDVTVDDALENMAYNALETVGNMDHQSAVNDLQDLIYECNLHLSNLEKIQDSKFIQAYCHEDVGGPGYSVFASFTTLSPTDKKRLKHWGWSYYAPWRKYRHPIAEPIR
jgi:hypothetical protein